MSTHVNTRSSATVWFGEDVTFRAWQLTSGQVAVDVLDGAGNRVAAVNGLPDVMGRFQAAIGEALALSEGGGADA